MVLRYNTDNAEIRLDSKKYALYNISKGENIIKYGFAISYAKCNIECIDEIK